jgi:hypothetical protein
MAAKLIKVTGYRRRIAELHYLLNELLKGEPLIEPEQGSLNLNEQEILNQAFKMVLRGLAEPAFLRTLEPNTFLDAHSQMQQEPTNDFLDVDISPLWLAWAQHKHQSVIERIREQLQ